MSQPSGDDIGVTATGYNASVAANASNFILTKDIGPIVRIYDPEWMAWLAGEIT